VSGDARSRTATALMLLPGVGFIATVVVLVLGLTGLQSLGLLNPTGESRLSLRFWGQVFDRQFLDCLGFSAYVGVASSLGSMVICYPLALALSRPFPGKGLLMPLIRVPLFVPALVATFLILNVLDYHGLANYVLVGLGLVREPLRMRNDPYGLGVLFIQLWKNAPFQLVLMASALEGIRDDVKDAARNLGAGPFRLFTQVILPLTVPSALVAIILVFIGTFSDFAVAKAAGPLYPTTISVLMHTSAYEFQEWNRAACMGAIMIAATIAFVAAYTRLASLIGDRPKDGGGPAR
jgi:putative spermidine/putrescine transport system permease protein